MREIKDDGYFSDFDGHDRNQLLSSVRDLEDQGIDGFIDYPGFTIEARLSRGKEKHSMGFLIANYSDNLLYMERTISQKNGKLILLTYAPSAAHYGFSNKLIRQFAKEKQIPLIDIAFEIAVHCKKNPCEDLFFADHHPTAKGYAMVASIVSDRLKNLLESGP